MNIPRVNSAENGESFFDEVDWCLLDEAFFPPSPPGYSITPAWAADSARLLHTPAGYIDTWHPVPRPMLVVLLAGRLRLETSDGDFRLIETGGLFVCADDRGRGHRMSEIDARAYDMLLVELDSAGFG